MDYSSVNDTFVDITKENSNNFMMENSTEASIESDAKRFPTDMLGFTAACAFIIAIFGTMGNLLTIFALPMSKKLRTTATAFVINLAVVELLFCVCILPMSGAQYAYLSHEAEPLLSDRDCTFFALARYTFTQVELQTILAIAFTRAIAVGFPRFYQKIDNKVVTGIYLFIIWAYSFFLKLATALGKFGSYVFNPVTMECDMSDDRSSRYARLILIIIEALVPVSIILILYIYIFVMVIRRGMIRSRKFHKPPSISSSSYYVKKSSYRVGRGAHKSPKPSLTSTASSSVSEDSKDGSGRKASITSYKSLKRMVSDSNLKARFTRRSSSTCLPPTSRRDMRVARMIFIIFMTVLICSVPVGVIHAIDRKVNMPRRFLAVHILYWLQYSLNVFVYVLMNRQYREAYIDFVARMMPSCERHKTFVFPWENPSISSRPPMGPNSSFKSKKDSTSQDPSAAPKEYKPVEAVPYNNRGRLSAILEVNSSSYVSSNDDVFVGVGETKDKDEKCGNKRTESNFNEERELQQSQLKNFHEEGTDEEKEKWLSQNGENMCNKNNEVNV